MNVSRIALLSAVFCVTSLLRGDVAAVEVEISQSAQSGVIANVIAVVKTPFNWADAAAGWIANTTYLNALIGKITNLSPLQNTSINNPETVQTIGKSMVALTAAYLAYQAYQALNDQNNDNDDEMIFVDEEYVEVN
jgi:hypothetical protein